MYHEDENDLTLDIYNTFLYITSNNKLIRFRGIIKIETRLFEKFQVQTLIFSNISKKYEYKQQNNEMWINKI